LELARKLSKKTSKVQEPEPEKTEPAAGGRPFNQKLYDLENFTSKPSK
jgi:hypothetical protein